MLISTRGRYALRVMLDLAEHQNDGYIAMKKVAERQGLSLKYIEKIMPVLSKNNYVEGVHGKGGGYRLSREPKDYKVGDILRLAEGDLAPVTCLQCNAEKCDRA
ncbi:MAG: Rrf2 family transcriptional regulator, partial [Clostridia bacterium]|nr:Rrf2 family transcriptional regulator [Clostridia bacterium]